MPSNSKVLPASRKTTMMRETYTQCLRLDFSLGRVKLEPNFMTFSCLRGYSVCPMAKVRLMSSPSSLFSTQGTKSNCYYASLGLLFSLSRSCAFLTRNMVKNLCLSSSDLVIPMTSAHEESCANLTSDLAIIPHSILLSVFSPDLFLHFFLVSSCSEAGTGIGGEKDLVIRLLPIPSMRADIEVVPLPIHGVLYQDGSLQPAPRAGSKNRPRQLEEALVRQG